MDIGRANDLREETVFIYIRLNIRFLNEMHEVNQLSLEICKWKLRARARKKKRVEECGNQEIREL